jgi:hypothetical protein
MEELTTEHDALDLLRAVYRNPQVPLSTRMRAAIAALPFEKPKLSAMALLPMGDLAERLDKAIARSEGARLGNGEGPKPNLIDHSGLRP